jgi:predicted MFS family arabinose efflux permease
MFSIRRPQQKAAEMGGEVKEWLEDQTGGSARLHIITLLAAILGLDTADKAAVSAVASGLKKAFDIGNTEIGILLSAVSLVGAIATLPMGVLVDKIRRQRLLAAAIAIWAVAMFVSGTATSFNYLLVTRLFLGIVSATAVPAIASLVGDFFPARSRSRIYGMILAGELVGTGFGFLLAGEVFSWVSWRAAFFALAVPSGILAWVIWRYLPEPARGRQGWLEAGRGEIPPAEKSISGKGGSPTGRQQREQQETSALVRREIRLAGTEPREDLILKEDPTGRSLGWVFWYVLRIRTNVLLIIASALGYYFFAGLRAFAMEYFTGHYGLSRSTVSPLVMILGMGALTGVVAGGRLADYLLRRGWLAARIVVPGSALFLSVFFFAPAIWTTNVFLAVFCFTVAAAALVAANPPLDAARLDIMHPRLWGRAESIRIVLRMLLEGAAPTVFGFISQYVFGGGQQGLQWTFLVMLIPLLIASALAIPARRTYPRDVATASASVAATLG